MSDDVVIVSAARTPVGSFNGAFATMAAHDLGAIAVPATLERGGIEPARVSEVIMGQILTASQGQNPARQFSITGIPMESPAWGVNQLCGSGLRTVALGDQALLCGDTAIVVAGGRESMSMAPQTQYLRGGTKMGPIKFVDPLIKDGLRDTFNGYFAAEADDIGFTKALALDNAKRGITVNARSARAASTPKWCSRCRRKCWRKASCR